MRFVKGFFQFWYDFLIGDDWKIAAAVLVVLSVGAVIVRNFDYDSGVLTALLALGLGAAFTTSLLIDVRPRNGPAR